MAQVDILISDGFPILSLTLVSEPLRIANRELGKPVFNRRIVSDAGGSVASSSGIPVQTEALPGDVPDATVLLASYYPDRAATVPALNWLRRLDRKGCMIGCVDTGALVLARAGLLGQRPAAVHPEAIAGFHRQFPRSLFVDRHADFSPPRFSSAGGVATLDMTLALISHFTSQRIARRVSEILAYAPPAVGWQPRPIPQSVPPALRDAVAIMEANLSECLSISAIAGQLGLPDWKLTRLFQRYLHMPPTSYYVQRRLARARDMLRNTTLPVADVGFACGYENAEAFSRAYKTCYGLPPSRDRRLDTGGGTGRAQKETPRENPGAPLPQ